jgi:hypothetical protein
MLRRVRKIQKINHNEPLVHGHRSQRKGGTRLFLSLFLRSSVFSVVVNIISLRKVSDKCKIAARVAALLEMRG